MPEPPGPAFPYHRIVEDLQSAILTGRLAPGERLSSEWELAQQYQTGRPTVRRAVALLKAEGLVITKQGQGAFVRPRPHVRLLVTGANYRQHRSAGLPGFNAQVTEQGQHPAQSLLGVGTIGAPPEVALRLDVETNAPVVVRLIRGGALAVIEDPAGPIRRTAARSLDELTSRMPIRAEIDQLKLSPGVPVMRVLRTIYDAQGASLEVQDSVAAADRHKFRYEVDMQ